MKINNVGIFVKDLEGAKNFFMDYFGAVVHAATMRRRTITTPIS